MFVEQVVVLGDITVVEIRNAHVEKNIEKERKVEDHKIKTVVPDVNNILNGPVDAKDPEWFDQEIQQEK
jgi:hypothetical protein